MITAFLIALILAPSYDLLALGGVALASVLAAGSKYLIAVRGRHILNPAAFAVLVVSLVSAFTGVGLGYQFWWVASPWLTIPVAIGAFLVLYRTQHLALGLVFIGVALVVRLVFFSAIDGGDPLAVLSSALLQYPTIFLAGFMLSEPLTLPPRRWQQLLVAGVVGLLFGLPTAILGLAPFALSPALALVVGNLLAFAFGQRRAIRMRYRGKRRIGDDTWEVAFEPDRPVRFVPGQYMELTVPHRGADFRGVRRHFSIASAPGADGPIAFGMTTTAQGGSSFKRALLDLEAGARVDGTLVGGDFALPRDRSVPLLLVAGGIGITPFASQLAQVTAGTARDVVVVYATSTPGELPYRDVLEDSGARVVLFAPEPPDPMPRNWVHAGSGRVTAERIAQQVPDVASRHAFVSGPPAMVHDLKRALRALRARRVRTDSFSGY